MSVGRAGDYPARTAELLQNFVTANSLLSCADGAKEDSSESSLDSPRPKGTQSPLETPDKLQLNLKMILTNQV